MSSQFSAERAVQLQSATNMHGLVSDILTTFNKLQQESGSLGSGFAGAAYVAAQGSLGQFFQDGKNQAVYLGQQADAWHAAALNQGAVDDATRQGLMKVAPSAPAAPSAPTGGGLPINRDPSVLA